MKIYIIGPSCSGKSTLANFLSKKLESPHVELDNIFFDFYKGKRGKIKLPIQEIRKRLNHKLRYGDWIIEGIQQIPVLFEKADLVIYVRPHILNCLINQWRRYFQDTNQRARYGLKSNVKLSFSIIRQFYETPDGDGMKNIRYSRVKKANLMARGLTEKLRIIRNRKELNQLTKELLRELC